TVINCDDHNPCTGPDDCDPGTGACSQPNLQDGSTPAGCSDGLLCTGIETCMGGQCVTALACPGQVCNPATQTCENPRTCQSGTECNDGNPCTDDVCNAGHCTNPPASNTTDCDDGNLCNGVRKCDGTGICQQPTPPT